MRSIILIKSDNKYNYNATKNKCCSFALFFTKSVVFNTDENVSLEPNQHIRMISEGSRDNGINSIS